MSLDKSLISSGLFRAFKTSVSKIKHRPRTEDISHNLKTKSIITATPGQIQVIKRTGEIESFDAHRISVAIEKAFLAIAGSHRHISILEKRINALVQSDPDIPFNLDQYFNKYFRNNLFSIDGALKLTAESNTLSIFKSFQKITASIIFITTRNFSIQKNLSISA